MPEIMQSPQSPDELARIAGRDIYETSVGMLRRAELWRLGNAWGMDFPAGASKDYMLPFFKQLEAEGKNPLRPPGGNLDTLVKAREVSHSEESHVEIPEIIDDPEPFPEPEVISILNPVDGRIWKIVDGKMVEADDPAPVTIEPEPKSEFEGKLESLPMGQLKKICKMRGIVQLRTDRKQDLVAKIVAASS